MIRTSSSMPGATRPDVILIVSDDHGYADRSVLGVHADVKTPALDRLAEGAVTCTDAYVTAPICSPSRAGLMTGRYQQRWGALWFESSHLGGERTLAERFHDLGYATGYLGKVHYGPRDKAGGRACPPNHGFDESFYGLAGGQMGRLNYLRHSRAAADEYGHPAANRMAVNPLWKGDNEVEHEGFLTTEFGQRARDFITSHVDEPFFLTLAFNAVHNFCWQLPPEELTRRGLPAHGDWTPAQGDYDDWYDDAIAPNLEHGRAYYLAQLELMDAEIGRLLDHLDSNEISNNTIVVYTTDNGGSTCNFGDNTPLAGTKYTLWEGGIRVPMLIRWPQGGVPAGHSNSSLVSTLDLTPTLLAAAGADPTAWTDSDGIDQTLVLRENQTVSGRVLHWHCGWQWAIRSGDWKLSYVQPDSAEAEKLRVSQHANVGSGYFLANLAADLGEQHNYLSAEPGIVNRLIEEHANWCDEVDLDSQTARSTDGLASA